MNKSISSDEVLLTEQIIIFYALVSLGFCLCIGTYSWLCCCAENQVEYEDLGLLGLLLIVFLLFLGILFGPHISVFIASSDNNFTEGCYTFALAHLFTNVSYPSVFLMSLKLFSFYEKKCIYKNHKIEILFYRERITLYTTVISVLLILGNLSFHFSKNFISDCNDDNLEKEKKIYVFSCLISYFVLNFLFSDRNILLLDKDLIFDKAVGVWLLINNLIILYLNYKVEENLIKREAFFTFILYFYFTFPIVFLVMLLYFIFDKIFIIFGEDHVPSYTINRNRTTHLNSPNEKSLFFKTDTNEWKYDEKNEKLKSHILEDTK